LRKSQFKFKNSVFDLKPFFVELYLAHLLSKFQAQRTTESKVMINLNSRGEVGKTKEGGRGNGARLLTTAIAKKLVYEAWFHAVGSETGGETLQPLNVLIVAAIKT
jgi:hypothetical protein